MTQRLRLAGARALALLLPLGIALAALPGLAGEEPRLVGSVNVNTATVEELQLLPGIGESRARALIAEREQRGGFESVEELLEVRGIGQASLERMRPFVTTRGKTTARIE